MKTRIQDNFLILQIFNNIRDFGNRSSRKGFDRSTRIFVRSLNKHSLQLSQFWTLSIGPDFLFKTQRFRDWILSPSSGGTYSFGPNYRATLLVLLLVFGDRD
jgi:hypothetical protein